MEDYTFIYSKQDVNIISQVFENFRDKCVDRVTNDPCYRYATPALSMLAGVKKIIMKVKRHKAEKTRDILLMIEKGIRGGIATTLGNIYVTTE